MTKLSILTKLLKEDKITEEEFDILIEKEYVQPNQIAYSIIPNPFTPAYPSPYTQPYYYTTC